MNSRPRVVSFHSYQKCIATRVRSGRAKDRGFIESVFWGPVYERSSILMIPWCLYTATVLLFSIYLQFDRACAGKEGWSLRSAPVELCMRDDDVYGWRWAGRLR
jgi:hypothetical protein